MLSDFLRDVYWSAHAFRKEYHFRAEGRRKLRILKSYVRTYPVHIFIETGTYRGDMVQRLKHYFRRIYTIELSDELYTNATARFKNDAHITLIHGDSSEELECLLPSIQEPALFWLDAHYSRGVTARGDVDTPIKRELELILQHPIKNHLILVDDARCFNGTEDYPTIEWVQDLFSKSSYRVTVADDLIHIVPSAFPAVR